MLLVLSSVLLTTSVCSVSDFGISIKWHCVCIKLHFGCGNFWNVERSFWRADGGKNRGCWMVFNSKLWVYFWRLWTPRTSVKDQSMKMLIGWGILSQKMEELLSMKFVMYWGISFGLVHSYLKDGLNMCVNCCKICPLPAEWSRKRIVLTWP